MMDGMGIWLVVGWVIVALFGWAIGKEKGRGAEAFWLTLILGPIGLIVAALFKDESGPDAAESRRPCPWCSERILADAKVCRFCNREVETV